MGTSKYSELTSPCAFRIIQGLKRLRQLRRWLATCSVASGLSLPGLQISVRFLTQLPDASLKMQCAAIQKKRPGHDWCRGAASTHGSAESLLRCTLLGST